MKKVISFLLVGLIIFPGALFAQATHSASMSWQPGSDSNSTTTYNVYRANAACPSGLGTGSLTFTKLASALTVTNYSDSTITVGNWCYYITQVTNGVESLASKTQTLGGVATPNVITFSVTIQ